MYDGHSSQGKCFTGCIEMQMFFSRFHGHESLRRCCTDIGPVIPQVASWRQGQEKCENCENEKTWETLETSTSAQSNNPGLRCQGNFFLFHQFNTKTREFAHIHPQSVTTLLLASGNYRPRHSTLLDTYQLPHLCFSCQVLFTALKC